jgi:hypothetical protein
MKKVLTRSPKGFTVSVANNKAQSPLSLPQSGRASASPVSHRDDFFSGSRKSGPKETARSVGEAQKEFRESVIVAMRGGRKVNKVSALKSEKMLTVNAVSCV